MRRRTGGLLRALPVKEEKLPSALNPFPLPLSRVTALIAHNGALEERGCRRRGLDRPGPTHLQTLSNVSGLPVSPVLVSFFPNTGTDRH